MSSVVTNSAEANQFVVHLPATIGAGRTSRTFEGRPEVVAPYLAKKPPRRPNRNRPLRVLTNEQLKRIAARHTPPAEWFKGEDECPF